MGNTEAAQIEELRQEIRHARNDGGGKFYMKFQVILPQISVCIYRWLQINFNRKRVDHGCIQCFEDQTL